jgi:hypothetical protein
MVNLVEWRIKIVASDLILRRFAFPSSAATKLMEGKAQVVIVQLSSHRRRSLSEYFIITPAGLLSYHRILEVYDVQSFENYLSMLSGSYVAVRC